jgi:transcriptional regulator with XRE-family HTH domain
MKRMTTGKVEIAFKDAGESIRTWRKLYRLKAAQVADRAGISLGTLRKIEKGDPGVGMDAFLEVLRSLGLLDSFTESLDPMNSDLGRARLSENLPERIR